MSTHTDDPRRHFLTGPDLESLGVSAAEVQRLLACGSLAHIGAVVHRGHPVAVLSVYSSALRDELREQLHALGKLDVALDPMTARARLLPLLMADASRDPGDAMTIDRLETQNGDQNMNERLSTRPEPAEGALEPTAVPAASSVEATLHDVRAALDDLFAAMDEPAAAPSSDETHSPPTIDSDAQTESMSVEALGAGGPSAIDLELDEATDFASETANESRDDLLDGSLASEQEPGSPEGVGRDAESEAAAPAPADDREALVELDLDLELTDQDETTTTLEVAAQDDRTEFAPTGDIDEPTRESAHSMDAEIDVVPPPAPAGDAMSPNPEHQDVLESLFVDGASSVDPSSLDREPAAGSAGSIALVASAGDPDASAEPVAPRIEPALHATALADSPATQIPAAAPVDLELLATPLRQIDLTLRVLAERIHDADLTPVCDAVTRGLDSLGKKFEDRKEVQQLVDQLGRLCQTLEDTRTSRTTTPRSAIADEPAHTRAVPTTGNRAQLGTLAAVGLMILGWVGVLWFHTGDARVAVLALVAANLAGCILLASRRR